MTTPTGNEFAVTITIMNSPDGGSHWNPSDVYTDSCSVEAFNLTVVVSEDLVDEDYNDAVCLISWPQSTESREESF